jgi:hypothetical protein
VESVGVAVPAFGMHASILGIHVVKSGVAVNLPLGPVAGSRGSAGLGVASRGQPMTVNGPGIPPVTPTPRNTVSDRPPA